MYHSNAICWKWIEFTREALSLKRFSSQLEALMLSEEYFGMPHEVIEQYEKILNNNPISRNNLTEVSQYHYDEYTAGTL